MKNSQGTRIIETQSLEYGFPTIFGWIKLIREYAQKNSKNRTLILCGEKNKKDKGMVCTPMRYTIHRREIRCSI
jgi:hypothetical protein